MLLPQIAEQDTCSATGQQTDDINSVAEYIGVALGYDHTSDDEDDDNGQNFHPVRAMDYVCQQEIQTPAGRSYCGTSNAYTGYVLNKPASLYYDIIAPPPKA